MAVDLGRQVVVTDGKGSYTAEFQAWSRGSGGRRSEYADCALVAVVMVPGGELRRVPPHTVAFCTSTYAHPNA